MYNYYNNQQLIRVTGLDGAKAYQMTPNSAVALFDGNEDIFYIKTTDGAGFPTIRAFKFEPIETNTSSVEYVSRSEFEALRKEITHITLGTPKSYYFPIIVWDGQALDASHLEFGDEVNVVGRIQSRTYVKDRELHTTYEVSTERIIRI